MRFVFCYDVEFLQGSAKITDDVSSSEERLTELSSSQKVRKRRNVVSGVRQVQGLSASQDCNGIILEWDALSLPFRYLDYCIVPTLLLSNKTDVLFVSYIKRQTPVCQL